MRSRICQAFPNITFIHMASSEQGLSTGTDRQIGLSNLEDLSLTTPVSNVTAALVTKKWSNTGRLSALCSLWARTVLAVALLAVVMTRVGLGC